MLGGITLATSTPLGLPIIEPAIDNIKDGAEPSALAEDINSLARAADSNISQAEERAKAAAINDATSKYGELPGKVTSMEQSTLEHESRLDELQRPALAAWYSALNNCKNEVAQVIAIGDSITEGADSGDIGNRWQTKLQQYLRDEYGVPSGARFPFIPAQPATSGATGWPVTIVGQDSTVIPDVNWGFGWRSAKVYAGGKVTFTFIGTSAKVMFTKASGVGTMRVVVDGGTPKAIDTNSVTNGPTSDSATWSTGPLTRGQHTVEITFDPSTPTGLTNVLVQGLLTWDGDETTGIRVIDSAHSGYRSGNFTANGTRVTANALKAAGGAALAVIAVGTNDTLYPADFPNYRANIERMIAALRTTAGFSGSVLLVHWYLWNQSTDGVWAPYGQIMAEIAGADPKVEYLDMSRRMPDMPSPYNAPEGLGYYAGNVHPGPRGYKFIADEMAGYLSTYA